MSDEERGHQEGSGTSRGDKEISGNDMHSSPHSSFEGLDPHDPILSRLATLLFRRTNEYLQAEIGSAGDNYTLLEEINRVVITRYTDLRNLIDNLNRTLERYNNLYNHSIKPLLVEIEDLVTVVVKLEENAYRLENYTKVLMNRLREMHDFK